VDVVAINHQSREILLGECKWGTGKISRKIVRDLIDRKAPLVRKALPQANAWRMHYAIFARAGLTEAAEAELGAHQGLRVDLKKLDEGLSN
jgi:hypothetical protein